LSTKFRKLFDLSFIIYYLSISLANSSDKPQVTVLQTRKKIQYIVKHQKIPVFSIKIKYIAV